MFNQLFNIFRIRQSDKTVHPAPLSEEGSSLSEAGKVGLPDTPMMRRTDLKVRRLAQRKSAPGEAAWAISRMARFTGSPLGGNARLRPMPTLSEKHSCLTFGHGSSAIASPLVDRRAAFPLHLMRRRRSVRSADSDPGAANSAAPSDRVNNVPSEGSTAPAPKVDPGLGNQRRGFASLGRSVRGRFKSQIVPTSLNQPVPVNSMPREALENPSADMLPRVSDSYSVSKSARGLRKSRKTLGSSLNQQSDRGTPSLTSASELLSRSSTSTNHRFKIANFQARLTSPGRVERERIDYRTTSPDILHGQQAAIPNRDDSGRRFQPMLPGGLGIPNDTGAKSSMGPYSEGLADQPPPLNRSADSGVGVGRRVRLLALKARGLLSTINGLGSNPTTHGIAPFSSGGKTAAAATNTRIGLPKSDSRPTLDLTTGVTHSPEVAATEEPVVKPLLHRSIDTLGKNPTVALRSVIRNHFPLRRAVASALRFRPESETIRSDFDTKTMSGVPLGPRKESLGSSEVIPSTGLMEHPLVATPQDTSEQLPAAVLKSTPDSSATTKRPVNVGLRQVISSITRRRVAGGDTQPEQRLPQSVSETDRLNADVRKSPLSTDHPGWASRLLVGRFPSARPRSHVVHSPTGETQHPEMIGATVASTRTRQSSADAFVETAVPAGNVVDRELGNAGRVVSRVRNMDFQRQRAPINVWSSDADQASFARQQPDLTTGSGGTKQSISRDLPLVSRFLTRSATSTSGDPGSSSTPLNRGQISLSRKSSSRRPVTYPINLSGAESEKGGAMSSMVQSHPGLLRNRIGLKQTDPGIANRYDLFARRLLIEKHGVPEAPGFETSDQDQNRGRSGSPASLLDTLSNEADGRGSARQLRPLIRDSQDATRAARVRSLTGDTAIVGSSLGTPVPPKVLRSTPVQAEGHSTVLRRVQRLVSRTRRSILMDPAGSQNSTVSETQLSAGSRPANTSDTGPTNVINLKQDESRSPNLKGNSYSRPVPSQPNSAEHVPHAKRIGPVLVQQRQPLIRPPDELPLHHGNKPVNMELALATAGQRESSAAAPDTHALRTEVLPKRRSRPQVKNPGRPADISRYPSDSPRSPGIFGAMASESESPVSSPSGLESSAEVDEPDKQIENRFEAWEIEFLVSKVYSSLKNRLAVEKERIGHPGFALWR